VKESSLSIAIVEDEPLFADLVAQSLSSSNEFSKITVLRTATQALAFDPDADIAVIDIDLGGQVDGVEIVHKWRNTNPHIGVVFLSNLKDPSVLLMIPEVSGVGMAYLHKRTAVGINRLIEVIMAVARGEVMIDSVLTEELFDSHSPQFNLTPHQERILRLIATGASNKKISDELGIPIKSVENATAGALRSMGIDGADPEINVRVTAAMTYIRLLAGVR